MKNTLIIVTLLLTSFHLFSQEETAPEKLLNDVITVDPFLPLGNLYFSYERALSFRSAIQIRGFYDIDKLGPRSVTNFQSYQIGLLYKYYTFKKRNRQQGLYIFGGANYRGFEDLIAIINKNGSIIINDINHQSPYLEIGIGYQFIFNKFLKGLTLDIDLSQEYAVPFESNRDFSEFRTLATSRISIGYSF